MSVCIYIYSTNKHIIAHLRWLKVAKRKTWQSISIWLQNQNCTKAAQGMMYDVGTVCVLGRRREGYGIKVGAWA